MHIWILLVRVFKHVTSFIRRKLFTFAVLFSSLVCNFFLYLYCQINKCTIWFLYYQHFCWFLAITCYFSLSLCWMAWLDYFSIVDNISYVYNIYDRLVIENCNFLSISETDLFSSCWDIFWRYIFKNTFVLYLNNYSVGTDFVYYIYTYMLWFLFFYEYFRWVRGDLKCK